MYYPELEIDTNIFASIESAEKIIATMPNKPLIEHMGNRAYYDPRHDAITLPKLTLFESAEEYYSYSIPRVDPFHNA